MTSWRSQGVLRYSPKLIGNRNEKWWLVVDCDEEIGRYFRSLYDLAAYRTDSLQRPSWSSHITVIRDEEPPNKQLWELYAGAKVEFMCFLPVRTDGYYYWLDVRCERLLNLREELGLPRQPEMGFHISVGHHE